MGNVSAQPRPRGRPKNEVEDHVYADVLRTCVEKNPIDKSSSTPLWVQVKNALSNEIGNESLPQDARLPSEQTICEIFSVSRPVVRAALGGLADEGLLVKVPRKGIFVSATKKETDFLTSNVSVHTDLEARGHNVTSETFEFYRTSPDEAERRVFNLPPDGTVVRVGRIYRSDGRPITHTQISLPGHKTPNLENMDISGQSIFQILKEKFGLVSQRAERWFTAEQAPAEVAERLEVAAGYPLIAIESIAYDSNDSPLEFYRAFYNSSVARIHVSTGSFKN